MLGIPSPLKKFSPNETNGRVVFPLLLDTEAFQRVESAAPLAAARRCHSALYQHSLTSYSRLFTLCAAGITKEPGVKKQFAVSRSTYVDCKFQPGICFAFVFAEGQPIRLLVSPELPASPA